jgi:hypothetical protein
MSKHKGFNKESHQKKKGIRRRFDMTPEQQNHILTLLFGISVGQLVVKAIEDGEEVNITVSGKETPSPTPPDDDPDPILD